MATSFNIVAISKLLKLTERRVQQLAKDGIIPKAERGKYDLVSSVHGYVDFLKANPKVEKMLKKASIPLADIAEQNLKMNAGEKSEKAIKKHAEDWIKANQSTFDSWIN